MEDWVVVEDQEVLAVGGVLAVLEEDLVVMVDEEDLAVVEEDLVVMEDQEEDLAVMVDQVVVKDKCMHKAALFNFRSHNREVIDRLSE